jgi:CRISPR type III-B/RAMP module RAMP protein Cmr6
MFKYYLPHTTEQLIAEHRQVIEQCKNLSLLLHKYPPAIAIGDTQRKSKWLITEIAPNDTRTMRPITPNPHIDLTLLEAAYKRWRQMITAAKAHFIDAKPEWRMVIGLGGNVALETDLTLHSLYGLPTIPGSALKGLTRAYVTGEIHKSEKEEDDSVDVKRIFGTQEKEGTVIFFDAVPNPKEKIALAVDIMNPHYPDYYQTQEQLEPKYPTNDQNPVPVTFLTISDTTFTFAIAPCKAENDNDAKQALAWLKDALQSYGIGGKTSTGYGYMQLVEIYKRIPNPVNPPPIGSISPARGIKDPDKDKQVREHFQLEDVTVLLQYQEHNLLDIVLVIGPEYPDVQHWNDGNQHRCIIERIEEREEGTVIYCKPAPSSPKKSMQDKKKKK